MEGVTMDVVLNDKIACHDEAGLINACEMMREMNSTIVRADVLYLNRKGTRAAATARASSSFGTLATCRRSTSTVTGSLLIGARRHLTSSIEGRCFR